jgi:hypothetical protein
VLEDRLQALSVQSHTPVFRLRKLVAFDRLFARLLADAPGSWLLKGGLALQLRLAERARTTQDIDLLLVGRISNLHTALAHAAGIELGDWF